MGFAVDRRPLSAIPFQRSQPGTGAYLFMPPSLLDSQLAILEAPYDEARAIIIDGNQPFDAVIRSIAEKLEQEA